MPSTVQWCPQDLTSRLKRYESIGKDDTIKVFLYTEVAIIMYAQHSTYIYLYIYKKLNYGTHVLVYAHNE